jgi:hypothetical protein
MIVHVVLFRPRPGVTDLNKQAMLNALRDASEGIPSVRRFHIGMRVKHGPQYEQAMTEDYPYAAIIEFDDLVGLQAYLKHPNHQRLGELFYELLDAGLAYDYSMGDFDLA